MGGMKRMAHRDTAIGPEDARMRAYWKYHGEGEHKVPREGVQPDHFYACSWCTGQRSPIPGGGSEYSDREWEQFLMPDLGPDIDPMALIAGRIG